MRSLLARFAMVAASAVVAACGGASSTEDSAGAVVLESVPARTSVSIAATANDDGTIWLTWTEEQSDLSNAVIVLRVAPDGRKTRWVLARTSGLYGLATVVLVAGRPLVGWYQQPSAGRYGVRVMAWDGTGWRDEVTVSGDGVTADFQLRAGRDETLWLLVGELLPLDGGSRCSVLRKLSAGTWGSAIEVVASPPQSAARCAIAPGQGGDLMATWFVQNIASTAPPSAVRAAYLAAGAQRFDAPTTATPGPGFVNSLESIGPGRWALLSYAADAVRNEAAFSVRIYRGGQWSMAIHPIGVSGETIDRLSAAANGAFIDLVWTGRRADRFSAGTAPRAARFDVDADSLLATQSLGPFNPERLIGLSVSAAADGRVAAGFGTGSGPGEAWLALADERGLWRQVFRINRPQSFAGAPMALPLPDGLWAAIWLEFTPQTGTFEILMRRL